VTAIVAPAMVATAGSVVATAPGKLLLAGEYAVLDGGAAIVAAVDRRVVARAGGSGALSPFLAAAAAAVATVRGPDSLAARAARTIVVDSGALRSGELKLGLGSSAAATVAAVACALAHEPDAGLDRDLVHRLAADAHAEAQGKKGVRGSGADIAASTHGGVIRFVAGAATPVRLPDDLVLVPFFTGHSADTAQLVAAVNRARSAAPRAIAEALATIAAAADALTAASDAGAAIAALDACGRAVAALGEAACLDLETAAVRAARRLSAPLGGTAKSCGAGGGDVALVAVPAGTDVTSLRAALVEAGCHPLDLAVDRSGVDIGHTSH
jgi:phosphomevalonate kinase